MNGISEQMQESRELRVFISSGFHDTIAERTHLAEQVFPELRSICRSRGAEFTGIDLRAGISPHQAQQPGLIRLGLDEIRFRRPYVVGLVGSHYGWVPSDEHLNRDVELISRYPHLAPLAREGRSLLDLEIEQGILADPSTAGRAFFYFRRPESDLEIGERENIRKLAALKERIRGSARLVREDFSDALTLGGWVRDDLIAVIDSMFPAGAELALLQRERRAHEGFAASRRRGYIPKRATIEYLDRFIDSDDSHLIITGDPGAGKSALVAHWTFEYRRRNPAAFVISHHVGAVAHPDTRAQVLRRVMLEIRERTGIREEIPRGDEELMQALPIWLAHAAPLGLLLVIDGANQLDVPLTEWLPDHLPRGVRAIITTTVRGGIAHRSGESLPELHLEPLSLSERLALGDNHFAGRDAGIDRAGLAMIVNEERSSNPLFLRTRLEELRLSGAHDRDRSKLDRYLAARDLPELFAAVLERMEEEFGEPLVRGMMGAIWASRYGLSEGEIERIAGCSRLELSEILESLDLHLTRGDGVLRFFHDALRSAVGRRYMDAEAPRREMRLRIARGFLEEIDGERRSTELLWQYREAEEWNRLRECLADIGIVRWLLDESNHYELFGYWLTLRETAEIAERYRHAIAEYERALPDAKELAAILNATGDFLRSGGRYADALPFLRRAVAIRETIFGDGHPDTARSYYDLASILQSQGELRESEHYYRRALAVHLVNGDGESQAAADAIDNLAGVLCARGEYAEAEILYRRALRIIEHVRGADHSEVAVNVNNLAGLFHDRGMLEEAEQLYRRALAVWEKSLGPDHPYRAIALNNLGAVRAAVGDNDDTDDLYRSALAIWERSLGPDHPTVASALANLAGLIVKKNPSEAILLLERALAIHEGVYRDPHPDTGILFYMMGIAHLHGGDLDAAERFLSRAFDMQNALLGAEHADTAMTLGALARVDYKRGLKEQGKIRYNKAIAILERECGAGHPRHRMLSEEWSALVS